MKILLIGFAVIAIGVFATSAVSQPKPDENFHSRRIGFSAGMGVSYLNAQDIVNTINNSSLGTQRVDDFKSAVEFFGAVTLPVSRDWVMKGEYVYLLASYNQTTAFGNAEFSYVIHMPTLIIQYMLFEAQRYNLKAGAGVGYHFASYEETFFASRYTGKGLGTLLELEGNTALGEDLFAHLGVQTRWDFIGNLTNAQGKSPLVNIQTTLHFFSVGARLGMTYYF